MRAAPLGLGREVSAGIGFCAPAEEAREGNPQCLSDLRVGQLALEVAQESHAERPRLRWKVSLAQIEADSGMVALEGQHLVLDPQASVLRAQCILRSDHRRTDEDLLDPLGALIARLARETEELRRLGGEPR
jgi:hypothetical protein